MVFKAGKKEVFYIAVFTVIVAGAVGFIYYQSLPKEITRYNFYGTEFVFRKDLRLAENVSVYPDEQSILNKVWNPDITKINIVYVPSEEPSEENGMLALSVFEIRFKLDVAYHNPRFNWNNEFTSTNLTSFENITQSDDTLVIALVRPSLSDRTAVEMDGNVIYIKGKTLEEFDKATIKFIMTALNITV